MQPEIIQEYVRDYTNGGLNNVIEHIHALPEEQRWNMLTEGIASAAETLRQRKSVLFLLVDDTPVGGRHFIPGLVNPENGIMHIAKPLADDTEQGKGQVPTVAHALEVIGQTIMVTDSMSHPRKIFVPLDEFQTITAQHNPGVRILIPLILNPSKTNAIVLHSQARRISPEALLMAYDQAIQSNLAAAGGQIDIRDWIRHTMFVSTKGRQPAAKDIAHLHVVEGTLHRDYSLIHPGRIASWDHPNPIHIQSVLYENGE